MSVELERRPSTTGMLSADVKDFVRNAARDPGGAESTASDKE
jgi:hypothetical protein